jgi:hypothetical protein
MSSSPSRRTNNISLNFATTGATWQVWDSGESSEDMLKSHEEILKDFLRVKKLSQRVSSVESK